MVHDSMRNLRLDKRLLRRRGWVEPAELEGELEALPDAEPKADRIPVLESTEASRESEAS